MSQNIVLNKAKATINQNKPPMKTIITGATKGIGLAIAKRFASAGSDLAISARTEEDLVKLKSELEKKYPEINVLIFMGDMGHKPDVMAFAEKIKAEWGAVDVLVNNVGWYHPGEILTAEEGLFEKMMQINLYSAYYLTRALLDLLYQNGKGHIFNICSIASLYAYPGSLYTISKFALRGFSQSLRRELKEKAVKVTAVLPGETWTPSWKDSGIDPNRLMAAEEVGRAVYDAWNMGPSTVVEEIVLQPQLGNI